MKAGCGCLVISAGRGKFTIRHRSETCKYRRPNGKSEFKQVIGDGVRQAVGSLWGHPEIIPLSMPWTGLFPYEEDAND